jgi:hypothetical protein
MIDFDARPAGVSRRAWEAVHRLYDRLQDLDDEHASVGQQTQDPEEARRAWLVMAAELISQCPACDGSGSHNDNGEIPCRDCRGSGRIL